MTERHVFSRDEYYMMLAMHEGRNAAARGEVPVGAVIVRGGEVIARSGNMRERARSAVAHAELLAIDEACEALGGWRLVGCELFVTLEPCPMCAGAIVNARLPRVVYGASDPKAGAMGGLFDLDAVPLNHHPDIVGGVLADECSLMLRDFFRMRREGRGFDPAALWRMKQGD